MTNEQGGIKYSDPTCIKHGKKMCEECYLTAAVEDGKSITIEKTAYASIGKWAFQCWTHNESHFISACATCVKEQLAAEYERGKKEAAKPDESETIKELRETLDKAHERVSTYYREKCYLEKQLAAAREVSKDKFQSLCDVQKMLSDLHKDAVDLCDKIAKARWEVK